MLSSLKAIQPPFTDRLRTLLNKALIADSVPVAEAASALCYDLVSRGVIDDPGPIERAFEYWQSHEQPTPSHGIIPRSPRETLLRALFEIKAVSDDQLFDLLRDARSDVRSSAEKNLLEGLHHSLPLRQRLNLRDLESNCACWRHRTCALERDRA